MEGKFRKANTGKQMQDIKFNYMITNKDTYQFKRVI